MKNNYRVLVPVAAFIAIIRPVHGAFCNALSTGPVSNGNFIREAISTLEVPSPSPQQGLLSLWTGMGMSNGDLIQALVESYAGSTADQCGELNGDWCSYASVLPSGGNQEGGPEVLTPPGAQITMQYVYNDSTNGYDQTVLMNGNVISTFSSSVGGKALGWGTAEECQPEAPCGLVPEHHWINTQLTLDAADPDYINTIGTTGASGTFSTPDGGLTWTCDDITINECQMKDVDHL